MGIVLELLAGGARLRGLEERLEPERKTAALLALLALEGAASRSRLAGLLWPETAERRARSNLRQMLHRLGPFRAAIGTGDPLRLADEVTVDAHDAAADGVLLDGFDYDDCPDLKAWLEAERAARVESRAARLDAAAERLEEDGDLEGAVRLARCRARLDPDSEAAVRRLMRLLARSGDRGAALAAYRDLRTRLEEEYGVAPSDETARLAELVRAGELPRRPSRLPRPETPFVGREEELRALSRHLAAGARVVAITGPGGIGKTRLALRAAERFAAAFEDGVAFVALGEVHTRAQLVASLGAAVGMRALPPAAAEARLLEHLRSQSRLLLVDGFEALPEARRLLAALLEAAPGPTLLVTSRHPTGLPEERIVALTGLRSDREALALFELAAARARPGLRLSPEERDAAREVCELMEGSPLGIELATAWLRSLSVRELPTQLRAGPELIAGGLEPVFARSWELLDAPERAVLLGLAVFHGGFDREAARAVAGATPRGLAALADRSLLSPAGAGRYALHALARHHLAHRLADGAVDADALRGRHARHFLARLTAVAARLEGPDRAEALARLEPDLANLRTAWRHAAEVRDVEALAAAAGPLALLCEAEGRQREGLDLLTHATARLDPDGDAVTRTALGRALVHGAWLGHQLGLPGAEGDARRGVDLLRAIGDDGGVRQGLFALGAILWYREDPRGAQASWRAALELAREHGDAAREARALADLGMISDALGEPAEARRHYLEALELSERLGDRGTAATLLNNLGQLLVDAGRPEEAEALLRRGLEHAGHPGAGADLPYLLDTLANALAGGGRGAEAEVAAAEAVAEARRRSDPRVETEALLTRQRLAAARGDAAAAEGHALDALGAAWRGGYRSAIRASLLALAEARAGRGDAAGAVPALRCLAAVGEATERERACALLGRLEPPPGPTPDLALLVPLLLGDAPVTPSGAS